jgi:hypothetical protein
MPDQAQPRFSREAPPEWGGLVAFAEDRLARTPEPDTPTAKVARAVFRRVSALDNERLAANRQFGQGSVMCGMAQALRQPEVRQRTVERAASMLTGCSMVVKVL